MSEKSVWKDHSKTKKPLDNHSKKILIWANLILFATIIVHDCDHVRQAICWNYQIPLYLYIVNIVAYLPSFVALALAFKNNRSASIATAVNGSLIAAGFAQIHLWKPFIPVWGIWNNNFFILGADAISWTLFVITLVVGVGVAMTGTYVRGRCSAEQIEEESLSTEPMARRIPIFMKFFVGLLILVAILWIVSRTISYGGDFTLNFNGKPWTYSQSAKKLNLLYFGYTECGDVCPITLTHVAEAFRQLSDEELKRVQLIFVSVDTDHDSSEEVSKFAMKFFPQFIGLNGNQQQIDQVIHLFPAGYFIAANTQSQNGYSINHTDKLFFMDQNGRMIDSLTGSSNSVEILEKIRKY